MKNLFIVKSKVKSFFIFLLCLICPVLLSAQNMEIPILQSDPDVPETIYLQFDTSNPLDIDGDQSSFSPEEKAQIKQIWEIVAEKFRFVPVNVTTDPTGYEEADLNKVPRTRVQFQYGSGTWSGGFFSDPEKGGIVLVHPTNSHVLGPAGAAGHELMHSFRLDHDSYADLRLANGDRWRPMTIGGPGLCHWSNGEVPFPDAPGRQGDDLEHVTSVEANALGYRTDDHGNTFYTASPLTSGMLQTGPIDVNQYLGIIERRTDLDVFKMNLLTGELDLTIKPTVMDQGMLHAYAELFNSRGEKIASSDPDSRVASLYYTVTVPGEYYLVIDGIGYENPENSTGYSDYGSLGGYVVQGDIPEDSVNPPSPINGLVLNESPQSGIYELRGLLQLPEDSIYTFYSSSDVLLTLDNKSVMTQGRTSDSAYLSAGLHEIRITYFGDTLPGVMDIEYSERGIRRKIIPDNVLYPLNPNAVTPKVINDEYTLMGEELVIPAATGLLFNDSDENGGPLTVSLLQTPANGNVNLKADGSFVYIPNIGFAGGQVDTFTFELSDGDMATANVTGTVTIQCWGDQLKFHDVITHPFAKAGVPSYGRMILDDGSRLKMTDQDFGKQIELDYQVTPNTMLAFDFKSLRGGAAYGIGFLETFVGLDRGKLFFLEGTKQNGRFSFTGLITEYENGPGFYKIPVGKHFLGKMTGLVFQNLDGMCDFSNVRIYESGDPVFSYTPPEKSFVPVMEDGFGQVEYMSNITEDVYITPNKVILGLTGFFSASGNDWSIAYSVTNNTNPEKLTAQIAEYTGSGPGYLLKMELAEEDFFSYLTLSAATEQATLEISFRIDWNSETKEIGFTDYNDIFTATQNRNLESFDLSANDPIGSVITDYDTISAGNGQVIRNPDGTFNYTPSTDFVGIDTFRYTLKGTDAGSLSLLVSVHVAPYSSNYEQSLPVNDLLEIAYDPNQTSITIDVLSNDYVLGPDTKIIYDSRSEKGAVISLVDNKLVYTSEEFFKSDSFSYSLVDPNNLTSSPAADVVMFRYYNDHINVQGVHATNQNYQRVAGRLIDGSGLTLDVHDTTAHYQMWDSLWVSNPMTLTFTLGGTYDLDHMHIWNWNEPSFLNRGARDVEIQVYHSSTGYVKLDDFIFLQAIGEGDRGFTVDLSSYEEANNAQLVRFIIKGNFSGDLGATDNSRTGLAEVRFYEEHEGNGIITDPGNGGFSDYQNYYDTFEMNQRENLDQMDLLANDPANTEILGFETVSIYGGSVSRDGNGTFSFRPAADFYGIDAFRYTINGPGESELALVVIVTVRPVEQESHVDDLGGSYTFQVPAGHNFAHRFIFTAGDPDAGIGFFDTYNFLGNGMEDNKKSWTLTSVPGEPDTYTIQSHLHGLYLDGDDSDEFDYFYDDRFEDTIVSRPTQNDDSQKWIIKKLENGHFTIQEKSNLYFMVYDFYLQKTTPGGSGNIEWVATPLVL